MKNNELLFEVLGEIDPALVQEAGEEVAGSPRAGGKRRVRWAVLAAAVLLFGVTAAALPVLTARMRTEILMEKDGSGGTDVYRMRLEDWQNTEPPVPEEVLAKLEASISRREEGHSVEEYVENGSMLGFDSWTEAAEWFDCGLLIPPARNVTEDGEGAFLAAGYNDGTVNGIRNIYIWGCHAVPGHDLFDANYNISAVIPLNDAAWEIYSGGLHLMGHAEDTEITEGALYAESAPGTTTERTFTSDAGDEVTLVSVFVKFSAGDTAGSYWNAAAHFVRGGIVYRIGITDDNRELAEERLIEIVNGMRNEESAG